MLNSSIWPEKAQRDIFITALLMAEPFELREPAPQIMVHEIKATGWTVPPGWYGFIPAASLGIIHRAMVEREEGLRALHELGEPDQNSKSKKFEGRRLVRVDGGFIALNYIEYRERDYTAAERSKRWRERKRQKAMEDEAKAKGGPLRVPGTRPKKHPDNVRELGPVGQSTRTPSPRNGDH